LAKDSVIAFSEEQQAAVIGHTFSNPDLWDLLDGLGFTKEWIITNALTTVVGYIDKFRQTFKRSPTTIQELVEHTREEPAYRKLAQTELAKCLEAAKVHGLDILKTKLVSWAKSSLIRNRCTEISHKYNEGKHDEAYKLLDKASLELQVLDVASGAEDDSFKSSADRLEGEEGRRLENAKMGVPYGIAFLDEACAGISKYESIMLGGRSGMGKTELARIISTNVAKENPVFYFALEAEPDEIERRAKYTELGNLYRANHQKVQRGQIDYLHWYKGLLQEELDKPYGKLAEERAKAKMKNLKTYYRKGGSFTIDNLSKKIYDIYKEARLIVIDHIHYVDFEGGEENREMKRLCATVRNVALNLGVPVLSVSHVRKEARGRDRALVPSQEDFHGSSDIAKIATTCIIIGGARGLVSSDSRATGKATYMRVPKSRLGGSLLYYCGVTFFDTIANEYKTPYSLGHLNYSETKWTPEEPDQIPAWAKNAVIQDVSEIDQA
jgi:KaiC/GvpD/RAD55 family RecA-like ATPase